MNYWKMKLKRQNISLKILIKQINYISVNRTVIHKEKEKN